MATDLEAVALWHDARARTTDIIGAAERATFHTEAAAAIRAAMGEIESNRALIARLRVTLGKAAGWFLDYARQHEAKTPPDTAKAGTNYERGHYCETAANDDGFAVLAGFDQPDEGED
jgi:hypothetical protein